MGKIYHLKRYHHIFYYYKNGGKFYGFRYPYYDEGHRRHEINRRNFTSLREAQRKLDRVKIEGGQALNRHKITMAEWIQQFLSANSSHWKISTYRNYVTIFRDFIIPYLGQIPVSNVNKNLYQRRCINVLARRGLKHNSLIDIHHRMITLMNSAVDNDVVDRNRLKRTEIPVAAGRIHKRLMKPDELSRFNRQLAHESVLDQMIFRTLENTGMREGELLGLKWRDVKLNYLEIHINHTRDVNGYRSPKTRMSKRTIGFSKILLPLFKRYREWQRSVFSRCGRAIGPDTFLITSNLAHPLSNTQISRDLAKILKRSGLGYLVGHFTSHTFRHMFASYLLNHHVPLTEVSHALGHANPQITLAIYTQRKPGHGANLGKQIEQIYHHEEEG